VESRTLPAGCRSRPARIDDTEAVAKLITAYGTAYGPGHPTDASAVHRHWNFLNIDEDSIIVEDERGALIGYADIFNTQYAIIKAQSCVQPERNAPGLRDVLAGWTEDWAYDRLHLASPNHMVVIRTLLPTSDEVGLELYASRGYEEARQDYTMAINLEAAPPEPAWPDGITVSTFCSGVDERAVFDSIEDSFRDVRGRPPGTFDDSFRNFTRIGDEAPDLWILAWAADEVVGVCLGAASESQGWILTVGVRRYWRRKGIGLALVHAGLGAFFQRGIVDVALSVDSSSPTSAHRVYERAGMRVVATEILQEKVLRQGVDIGLIPDQDG
jgi:mycothiol synthase